MIILYLLCIYIYNHFVVVNVGFPKIIALNKSAQLYKIQMVNVEGGFLVIYGVLSVIFFFSFRADEIVTKSLSIIIK